MEETWNLIDAFEVSEHFSRFPAGIAHNSAEVVAALRKVIEFSCSPGSKEEKKAITRHLTADNEPFAICHCTAIPERLVILSSIIELAWINDDVTEELDHKTACEKHEILKRAMDLEKLLKGHPGRFNPRETLFGLLVQKAAVIDPNSASKVVEVLSHYLDTFDSSDEEFTRMEDYNPYRVGNCGYWISSFFIRWGMGLTLTDAEYESIREFDFSMGIILGLTNDYFSWHVEKDQDTDRVRNAVRVLMKEYGVLDTVARTLLRGMIVDEEEKACRLKEKILASSPSLAIVEYIKAIELYVGGSCYWHATAPRYKTE
ncbi:terpene synthase family protein [Aspergillus alliaceus]|uniref:terpene synthase family protein n=1 Tax=Petromyces alliaceus TaxID=209559 RepID=UPI0012A706EF|nr:isoprenoid synthase domain-containing protein [Aspergillus alliaceus]KAB8235593.1 isoprenoid synthase domain-containing protein [Aspergillus alliaceus]